jgi:hypothetical protein
MVNKNKMKKLKNIDEFIKMLNKLTEGSSEEVPDNISDISESIDSLDYIKEMFGENAKLLKSIEISKDGVTYTEDSYEIDGTTVKMMRVKQEVGSNLEEIIFLKSKIEEVNNLIDQAVEEEEYELASNLKTIREELKTKLNNLTK